MPNSTTSAVVSFQQRFANGSISSSTGPVNVAWSFDGPTQVFLPELPATSHEPDYANSISIETMPDGKPTWYWLDKPLTFNELTFKGEGDAVFHGHPVDCDTIIPQKGLSFRLDPSKRCASAQFHIDGDKAIITSIGVNVTWVFSTTGNTSEEFSYLYMHQYFFDTQVSFGNWRLITGTPESEVQLPSQEELLSCTELTFASTRNGRPFDCSGKTFSFQPSTLFISEHFLSSKTPKTMTTTLIGSGDWSYVFDQRALPEYEYPGIYRLDDRRWSIRLCNETHTLTQQETSKPKPELEEQRPEQDQSTNNSVLTTVIPATIAVTLICGIGLGYSYKGFQKLKHKRASRLEKTNTYLLLALSKEVIKLAEGNETAAKDTLKKIFTSLRKLYPDHQEYELFDFLDMDNSPEQLAAMLALTADILTNKIEKLLDRPVHFPKARFEELANALDSSIPTIMTICRMVNEAKDEDFDYPQLARQVHQLHTLQGGSGREQNDPHDGSAASYSQLSEFLFELNNLSSVENPQHFATAQRCVELLEMGQQSKALSCNPCALFGSRRAGYVRPDAGIEIGMALNI